MAVLPAWLPLYSGRNSTLRVALSASFLIHQPRLKVKRISVLACIPNGGDLMHPFCCNQATVSASSTLLQTNRCHTILFTFSPSLSPCIRGFGPPLCRGCAPATPCPAWRPFSIFASNESSQRYALPIGPVGTGLVPAFARFTHRRGHPPEAPVRPVLALALCLAKCRLTVSAAAGIISPPDWYHPNLGCLPQIRANLRCPEILRYTHETALVCWCDIRRRRPI